MQQRQIVRLAYESSVEIEKSIKPCMGFVAVDFAGHEPEIGVVASFALHKASVKLSDFQFRFL